MEFVLLGGFCFIMGFLLGVGQALRWARKKIEEELNNG